MTFQPAVNEELTIEGVTYRVAEHPHALGMVYGQEGRQAVVYQLVAGDERRALKVFKPLFRLPALTGQARRLAPLAALPGLRVCARNVLTPQQHVALLREHPDLTYAVLMPWIPGPTWLEVVMNGDALDPATSLSLARALADILTGMEQEGLAHCDLSGANLLLPALDHDATRDTQHAIELVDVEQFYGPDLKRPDHLPAGSPGYAHYTATDGLWTGAADRFAGAVLLAELLGWCDRRVRAAAWGESYFDPPELQQPGPRYETLRGVLATRWGGNCADLLARAWGSTSLAACPTFAEWLVALPERVPTVHPATPAPPQLPTAAAPASVATPVPDPSPTSAPATHVALRPPAVPAPIIPIQNEAESAALFDKGLAAHRAGGDQRPTRSPAALQPRKAADSRPRGAWRALIVVAGPLLLLLAVVLGARALAAVWSNANAPATAITPRPTLAPAGSATTATAQALAAFSVSAGTPVPEPTHPITPDNAGAVRQLAGWDAHGNVTSVAFSPDGRTLACGLSDGTVQLWSVATGKPLQTLMGHTNYVTSVAFAPDGRTLASGSGDDTVRLWRVSDGTLLQIFTGHTAAVFSVVFSPDGGLLASGSGDTTVRLWSVATGKPLQTLTGHTGYVRSVAFAPDGHILASGSGDNTVRLWRVSNATLLQTLTGHTDAVLSVTFSPDGGLLASGSGDGTVRLWRVASGEWLATLAGHTSFVWSVVFAPDGRTLASGSDDRTLRLWAVSDHTLLTTLTGHTWTVKSVAFAPDGRTLASGSTDDTVRLWGLP